MRDVEIVDGKRPCTRCGKTKPVDEFYVETRSPGRRRSQCIECDLAAKHERYTGDAAEKARERSREWRAKKKLERFAAKETKK